MRSRTVAFEEQLPLDLGCDVFSPSLVDVRIVQNGLSHFRHKLAEYGSIWPESVPDWLAWVRYYERVSQVGFRAAASLKPVIAA